MTITALACNGPITLGRASANGAKRGQALTSTTRCKGNIGSRSPIADSVCLPSEFRFLLTLLHLLLPEKQMNQAIEPRKQMDRLLVTNIRKAFPIPTININWPSRRYDLYCFHHKYKHRRTNYSVLAGHDFFRRSRSVSNPASDTRSVRATNKIRKSKNAAV